MRETGSKIRLFEIKMLNYVRVGILKNAFVS